MNYQGTFCEVIESPQHNDESLCVFAVDEKERAHGLYPEEELFETGYHEYQRP